MPRNDAKMSLTDRTGVIDSSVKLTPWLRVVLAAVVLSNDYEDAARRLHVPSARIRRDIIKIRYATKTKNPMLAAIKLGILKIDYENIPDWLSVDEVFIAPGLSMKITSRETGVDSSSWQLETQPD
jgi:hypothetical protein